MKNSQKGFVAPLIIVIVALVAIGGGVYMYANRTESNSQITSAPSGYFEIPELGIKFKISEDIKDLTYWTEDFGNKGKVAYFTTQTLVDADARAGGKFCSEGAPLGAISLYNESGERVSTGYYSQPHDVCSSNKDVSALQGKLKSSFIDALKTSQSIK